MKSHSRINQNQIVNFALVILTGWCVCLYLTYLSLNFDITKFYYFPFLILLTSTLIFLWPFKHFYASYRYEIIYSIIKSCFPFGNILLYNLGPLGVTYRDFIIAECFISLIIPLLNFNKAICLFMCTKCKEYNINDSCKQFNGYLSLFISVIPYFLRVSQCLNKYHYTKKKVFLLNLIKNSFGILLAIFFWFYVNGTF